LTVAGGAGYGSASVGRGHDPEGGPVTSVDACPGILDLHEARDGHVARVRLPGGYVTVSGLHALGELARRYGDGRVDLTSRGNVQLRGVRAGDAGALSRQAAADGLLPSPAHDRARNIVAGPLAGLCGRPDVRPLVEALDRGLRADPALAALPGRFLFSVDDGGGRAGLGTCDVGLRRHGDGVDLVLAGRTTGIHAVAGEAAGAVALALAAARAFLDQRQASPDAARVAGLPDGGAAVAAGVGGRMGGPVADTVTRLPLGPVPGAAAVVVVAAPLSRLDAAHLDLIAALLRRGAVVRLAAAGRVVVPLAGPAEPAVARLAAAGLLAADDHPLAGVTACSGTACERSLADVRALATRLGGDPVHWVGCARMCAPPPRAVLVAATTFDRFLVGDDPAPRRLGAAAVP
jgi:precorrin-3B synthase